MSILKKIEESLEIESKRECSTPEHIEFFNHSRSTFRPYLLALKKCIEQRDGYLNVYRAQPSEIEYLKKYCDEELSQLLEGTKETEGEKP
jgi:hypothetical protein